MTPRLVLMLCIVFVASCNNTASTTEETSTTGKGAGTDTKTSHSCECVLSRDNLVTLYRAYSNKDIEALAGLVSRGDAIQLQENTDVHILARGSGGVSVLVGSGFYSGKSCWLFENFLQ